MSVSRPGTCLYEALDAAGDEHDEMLGTTRSRCASATCSPTRRRGTRARITARGEPKGSFRLTGPMLNPMVRGAITKDLEHLRDHLEGARTA